MEGRSVLGEKEEERKKTDLFLLAVDSPYLWNIYFGELEELFLAWISYMTKFTVRIFEGNMLLKEDSLVF